MTTELNYATSHTESTPLVPSLEEVLAQARRNSLTRENPLLSGLPDWFEGLRDHQRLAIREILCAYEEGAKCVVLDAPTGSGKTLIGETVRRLLPGLHKGQSGGSFHQSSYICSSKALQDQFIRDYPYAKVLKGRSNYPTDLYPERFYAKDPLTCADCTKSPGASDSCMWCVDVAGCPYDQAKSAALSSDLAVLNTSYFLSECNGPGRFSRGGLVIVDECLAAGTQISTPDGCRNIEDIRVGDVVWGEENGKVVMTTVTRTMVSEGSTLSLNGLEITGNHPILTDRGYVEAAQILPLDKIAVTGLNPSHGTTLRMVPTALPGEEPSIFQRKAAEVLWRSLLRGVQEESTEKAPQGDLRILCEGVREHKEGSTVLQPTLREQVELASESRENGWGFGEVYGVSQNASSHSQTKGMAAESRQSDLQPCRPAKSIRDAIGAGVQSLEWRQWYRTHGTSENISGGFGMGDGSDSEYRKTASTLLQDRRSQSELDDRGGSGWREPSEPEGAGSGQKKDGVVRRSGLGDSASAQQANIGEPGSGSGQDSNRRVYNLSTGTHNYIANGIVVHNCDSLEAELMSHVEVRISERRLKQYGLGVPKFVTKEESWREWAEDALQVVSAQRPIISNDQVRNIREAKRHSILVNRLKDLRVGLQSGDWVYTGDRDSVAFKPVTVSRLGQDKLWAHGDKWLLMSATVISADEMLESLGWSEDDEWRLVKCPSTFKPENRKVVVWPVASMTYKTRDESIPKMVEAIKTICADNPDERILIHSTSYSLTNEVVRELTFAYGVRRKVFTYTESKGKDEALSLYLATPGAIMVAPSLDRGIDLPGDHCRVQIICKVPFLSIKDKQVSARLYGTGRGGKIWYAVNAIRTIIQMCGRAVRSEEDYAVTYILDRQFVDNLYGGYRNLIPAWWKESLTWKKVKE